MLDMIKEKYNISNISPLEGGYSFCDKYRADAFVLKVFKLEEYNRLIERMNLLTELNEMSLSVPKVIGYGKYEDKCYQLLEFIDGLTGREITSLSLETQYNIGVSAGKELKQIHTLECEDQVDIYKLHKDKIIKVYKEFKQTGIKYEHEKLCINYINNHIYLLKDRRTYLLHGDYHVENMSFDETGYLGAFDFERNKKTDYVRDLERVLVFTRQFSLPFTKGFLKGYEFKEYKILKLYLIMGIFNSFVWAYKDYPDDIPMFKELADMIISDFDGLRADMPLYMEDSND